MDIITKAVSATIEDTSGSADEFPGTFEVELSNESLDRDGDTLKADEWETPLPQQITFVNDHDHKMKSVVGSAVPTLENGKIICRGTWAATDTAQDTRKVVGHVPYVSVAYREKRHQKGGVTRELINGSFVVVPSNPNAKVLASKSFEDLGEEGAKDFADQIGEYLVKQLSALLPSKSGSVLPGGFTAEVSTEESFPDATLHIKSADGKTILSHKFLQDTQGAPPKGADPEADPAKDEATELAHAKALAAQITTGTDQFI